jgi:hypothetical protein
VHGSQNNSKKATIKNEKEYTVSFHQDMFKQVAKGMPLVVYFLLCQINRAKMKKVNTLAGQSIYSL